MPNSKLHNVNNCFTTLMNSRSLLEMGTKDVNALQLSQMIGRETGGISVYPFTSLKQGSKDPVSQVIIRGKSMSANTEALFNLVCSFSWKFSHAKDVNTLIKSLSNPCLVITIH